MYLGIDVGGTKTLLSVFDERGKVIFEKKFHTPQNYSVFLEELKLELGSQEIDKLKSVCIGLPASLIDRDNQEAKLFTNLAWRNVRIVKDLERLFPCPIYFENDAKLAAFYEAGLVGDKYQRVLYVTISTGIGYALVNKGQIDTSVGDPGGSDLLISFEDKMTPWENVISGRAIVERFGKQASEINDQKTWKLISRDINQGLMELIAILEPDVVIFGGAVGEHFSKFSEYLREELNKYKLPSMVIPDLIKAKEAERAVVFGCYEYARSKR